jgi:protein disulfide-isomerase
VKSRNTWFVATALVLLTAIASSAGESSWLTDYKKAQEQAKADRKLLLLDFTGSDWCGWCIKLNKEVFSQPQFKDYATKNLVLMEVDFPRAKEQSGPVRQQNEQLAMRFRVQGFPTIIVLNAEGKVVGQLSYDSSLPEDAREFKGTPEAFIANLEKLRKS